MKNAFFFLFIVASIAGSFLQAGTQVYCNPLNISYRFCLDQPSRREAADPTVILYKDNYYLFASKSGGYWYSADLATWNFVTTSDLPLENYAPTAIILGDWVYFFCSNSNTIYRSNNPIGGKWEVFNNSFPISTTDPALFVDSDGKVYFYYGCSNESPIQAIELDVNNKLNPKGTPVSCISGNPAEYGWERPGDYNKNTGNPWIEGAWMNKFNGRYYLQYAGPGTEYKSYGDGVYVSDSPLGPFTYATNNPFSTKPEGFIAGAGHGSTFEDKYGNWWHIATMSISVKHMFERRLGLFPAGFDREGNLFARTDFGDYPISIPDHKYKDVTELIPEWNLLSYHKTAEASSSSSTFPVSFAFDENVRSYWSALSGSKGEWLSVDLGTICSVHAVQVNFAENNTQILGRNTMSEQYLVEYSSDKQRWSVLIDKTTNEEDLTHQFTVIPTPVKARYIRVTNFRVPGGSFAISDLRIFGKGTNIKTSGVDSIILQRSTNDPRTIKLTWRKQKYATGYNIRFGAKPDMLYRSYEVYVDTSVTIGSLNKHQSCFFEVDAFDENGIVKGTIHSSIISIQPTVSSVYPGSIVRFRTDAFSLSATFQWQEDSGNGFVDLSDRLPYANTKSRLLNIYDASTILKKNKYRCVVTDGKESDTTSVVYFNMLTLDNKHLETDKFFDVFPYPSKNKITIVTSINHIGLNFYIINDSGFYVLTGKLASLTTVLDIDRLSAGNYLVQVG
jgi:xylan 1,4-beta-xylosidase